MYSGETGASNFCWAVSVLAFAKPEVEGPTCLARTWSSGAASVSLTFGSALSVALTRPQIPHDEICISE
jgi:hypothetical protein